MEYLTFPEFNKFTIQTNDINEANFNSSEDSVRKRINNILQSSPTFTADHYMQKYVGVLESRVSSLENQIVFDRKLIEEQQFQISRQQQLISDMNTTKKYSRHDDGIKSSPPIYRVLKKTKLTPTIIK